MISPWCKLTPSQIIQHQTSNSTLVYWYDGATWLICDNPSKCIALHPPSETSWLPKEISVENALFLGWNMWGQAVILNTALNHRFVRRAPRRWVCVEPKSPHSPDALFLDSDSSWRSTILSWVKQELFTDASHCHSWLTSQKQTFQSIPGIDLINLFYNSVLAPTANTTNPRQMPYSPLSAQAHSAFVPIGLQDATNEALNYWQKKHPNETMDEFVSRETPISITVLSGEQVDAVGLAISSITDGFQFLLGDQTGLGKGRVLATLATWAQSKGFIPVFFTERPSLFHDFWRDMEDVSGNSNPFSSAFTLHQSVKLSWPDGTSWKNPHTSKSRTECISNGTLPIDTNLILTTYSQFNRNDPAKIQFLKNISKKAIFFFDEAHNATGQSNIRDSIKAINKNAAGCVYSSATFGKDSEHVAFYTNLIGSKPYIYNLEDWLARPDSEPLRVAVSQKIVSDGRMVRREQDLSGLVYKQRTLPSSEYASVAATADNFSRFASGMLGVQTFLSKNFPVNPKNKVDPTRLFGGRLYRLNRLMLLMLSLKFTAETAIQLFSTGVKPVLVCETTLEQAMSEADDESCKIDRSWGSFADILCHELDNLIDGWFIAPTHAQTSNFSERKLKFTNWIQSTFAFLPPSPIDAMKSMLAISGLRSAEVSGRSQCFVLSNGSWVPQTITEDRVNNVRLFNSGEIDVLVVTKAGCSGISLHASTKFKDQRPRELVEWQTLLNVADRVQFFGRVYRKGQVVPSSVSTQVLGLPAERRGHILQARKMQKLFQFTVGQTNDYTFGGGNEDYLEHPKASQWGKLWLIAFPEIAKLMGLTPDVSRNVSWLDRIFSRLSLLSLSQQESVLSFWDTAAEKILFTNNQQPSHPALIQRIDYPLGVSLEGYIQTTQPIPIDSNFDSKAWLSQLNYWQHEYPYISDMTDKLSILTTGATLRWRDASRRKTVTGRILGVWMPDAPYNSFWRAASIHVWSPELESDVWVPLHDLFSDTSFIIDTRQFSLDAAEIAHSEFHRAKWALCGEPERLILWKTHHRMGTWSASDANRLWLPSFISNETFTSLSWPLGVPTWCLKYAKYYANEESLIGFDTNGKEIYFSYASDGNYTLTWADGGCIEDGQIVSMALRQKYGSPRNLPTGRVALTVPAKDGASLIFHLASRGLYFGVPASRQNVVATWELCNKT